MLIPKIQASSHALLSAKCSKCSQPWKVSRNTETNQIEIQVEEGVLEHCMFIFTFVWVATSIFSDVPEAVNDSLFCCNVDTTQSNGLVF